MPFIPIPNVAQVAMRFTQDNQELANVYHVSYSGAADGKLLEDIGERFISWWDSAMQPFVSATVSLREVAVVDQSVEDGIGVLVVTGLPLAGGNVNNAMPNQTTVAVKWPTGRTGRSYRGRTFHIGLTENQVLNNNLETAALSSLRIAYQTLLEQNKSALTPMVVASRYTNKAPRVVGISTELRNPTINPVIDSQIRRKPGRGR